MDIEERIEIRADLIYTGILDAVERLKNQSVDVFMEKVRNGSIWVQRSCSGFVAI